MRRIAILSGCLLMLGFALFAPSRVDGKAEETPKDAPAVESTKPAGTSRVKTPQEIKARLQKTLDEVASLEKPRVLVIPIREIIELRTAVYVERGMETAAEGKYDLVVVDMHTPGGRLDATTRICDVFSKSFEKHGVPVISWVNTNAFSAGAIISFACDRITMETGGKMGAATGVFMGPKGPIKLPEDVAEKYASALRAEVRSLAKAKGHSPAIGMGMVDRQIEVVEVEIDGVREYLSRDEADRRARKLRGKVPVWDQKDLRFREIGVFSAKGSLITLDFEEALKTGVIADIVDSRKELFDTLGLKDPVVTEASHNWSEEVFGFLASGAAKGILLMLGLMGLYMEFKVPGFGLPGIFGITCLALFFFSQHFMGIASYAGAVAFVAGCALLLIEIFVIPGFGVTGVMGIILMVVGLMMGMQPFVIPDIANPMDMDILKTNILAMGIALIGLMVFVAVLAKIVPSTPLLRRIILGNPPPDAGLEASATTQDERQVTVGARGTVLSSLRPAGRVQFGKKLLDAVAEGAFIGRGSTVQVLKVKGNRIVVREVTEG